MIRLYPKMRLRTGTSPAVLVSLSRPPTLWECPRPTSPVRHWCANLAAETQPALDRHRRIVLGNEDRDRFLNSFAADEDPNEALIQAARDFSTRHTK